MGFLRRKHAFRVSALSLSVPLNGCDTVMGLQELQRQKDGENLSRALQAGLNGMPGKTRRGGHYKGPYPSDLTMADLKNPPHPWRDFLWGQGWHSHNLPEDLSHLQDRVSENLVHGLANYLRLILGVILSFMLMRPWAILGALIILAVVLLPAMLEAPAEEGRGGVVGRVKAAVKLRLDQVNQVAMQVTQAQTQHREQGQRNEQPQKDAQTNWSYVACLCVAAFTNLLWVVLRALIYSIGLLVLHAAVRRTPSEQRVEGVGPSGVSLLEVLGVSRGRSEDPRRLLREVAGLVMNVSSAAGLYAWHAAQAYCVNTLRYFRR